MGIEKQINYVLTAEDRTKQVFGSMETAFGRLGGAVNVVKDAMAALGVTLSVGAFTEIVEHSISAMEALKNLSEATGVSVENLSALQETAKLADTDIESVATGFQKLARNALDASNGTGKSKEAFAALGIQLTDANGQLRPSIDLLRDSANALFGLGNETQRVALAQQLFGKAGAQLLPFLKELRDAGELTARVTSDQAEQADHYHDNLVKIGESAEMLKLDIAKGLLPALNQITDAMLKMQTRTDTIGFWKTMGDAIRVVAAAAGALFIMLKEIGQTMAGLSARATALLRGDFAGVLEVGNARGEQSSQNWADFQKMLDLAMGNAPGGGKTAIKGKRAGGGSVDMSGAYLVGEDGPELFVPGANGYVFPNAGGGSGGASRQSWMDATSDGLRQMSSLADEFGRKMGAGLETSARRGGNLRDVIRGLGSDLQGLLTGIIEQMYRNQVQAPIAAAGSSIMQGIFGSLFSSPGYVSSGSTAATFNSSMMIPAYASGTPYVPSDGLAYLHRGEAVVPAGSNPGGVRIVNHYNIDSRTDQATIVSMLEANRQRTVSDVHRALRSGGPMRKELER